MNKQFPSLSLDPAPISNDTQLRPLSLSRGDCTPVYVSGIMTNYEQPYVYNNVAKYNVKTNAEFRRLLNSDGDKIIQQERQQAYQKLAWGKCSKCCGPVWKSTD